MNILYITTIGSTMGFFKSFIPELLAEGHTVAIACNETEEAVPPCYRDWGCKIYPLSCTRSPLDRGNLAAVREIKALVEKNHYDIVHCHTPVAAACTRMACRGARKQGTKVFYTAHGFHFYKGAPLKNWLIYYPVEKLCARWTDTLITINQEDYALAKKKMPAKSVAYVPGVGIDADKFRNTAVERTEKRRELGIPEDAFLLLSVGELNENKNHQAVIKALAQLNNPQIHYAIAGSGALKDSLIGLAGELKISQQVHLLGFRTDVAELDKAADAYVLPSLREGLNVSLMEAMAAGLPCIASGIRGNTDLIDSTGGFLCAPEDVSGYAEAVQKMYAEPATREAMGQRNAAAVQAYSIAAVNARMRELYGV